MQPCEVLWPTRRQGFGVLEELPFDPSRHRTASFDCGVRKLNEYLQHCVDPYRRQGITLVYVLVDTNAPARILGYSASSTSRLTCSIALKISSETSSR